MKNKDTKKKYNLIVDLSSLSVSVALFDISFGEKKYESKRLFSHSSIFEKKDFFDHLIFQLNDVLSSIDNEDYLVIGEVSVFGSAPWISSQKEILRYEEKEAFECTDVLINKILADSKRQYTDAEGLIEIEKRASSFSVNGYSVVNPVGAKAKSLEVSTLSSVVSVSTKNAIESAIEKFTHVPVTWYSRSLVHFTLLQDLLPHEGDILTLELGGDLSEISRFKNDYFEEMSRFPVGIHTIIRSFAHRLHYSYEKAESLLKLASHNLLSDNKEKEISSALVSSYRLWLKEFYLSCKNLSKSGLLPSTLCLLVDADVERWFRKSVSESRELNELFSYGSKVQTILYSDLYADYAKKNSILAFDDYRVGMNALFLSFLSDSL